MSDKGRRTVCETDGEGMYPCIPIFVDDSKFARVYSAVISDLKGGAILTNHCPNPQYRQFTLVKETEA